MSTRKSGRGRRPGGVAQRHKRPETGWGLQHQPTLRLHPPQVESLRSVPDLQQLLSLGHLTRVSRLSVGMATGRSTLSVSVSISLALAGAPGGPTLTVLSGSDEILLPASSDIWSNPSGAAVDEQINVFVCLRMSF